MSAGLGAAYSKKWRESNPHLKDRYSRSVEGRYSQLKRAAKRGSYTFDISLQQYRDLVEPNLCAYCKGPLCDHGYSLDRFDNRKGYVLDNVVPCCGVKNGKRSESCNFIKGHLECAGFTSPRTVELLLEILDERTNRNRTDDEEGHDNGVELATAA